VHEWAAENGLSVGALTPVPVTVAEAYTGTFAQLAPIGGR